MRRLWAHRDACLYIAGQGLSTVGDSALWLATGIWVKILTGSNSAAGLVFFAYIAGNLLGPAAGLLVDRMRRRPLLIAANLATGVLVCALLAVTGRGQVWLVYPVMAGYGAASGLISAAFMVCVQVPQAASIALGAALVAVVDYRVLLAVMAAVVLISAGCLARGVVPAAAGEAGPRGPATADAGADKA